MNEIRRKKLKGCFENFKSQARKFREKKRKNKEEENVVGAKTEVYQLDALSRDEGAAEII